MTVLYILWSKDKRKLGHLSADETDSSSVADNIRQAAEVQAETPERNRGGRPNVDGLSPHRIRGGGETR